MLILAFIFLYYFLISNSIMSKSTKKQVDEAQNHKSPDLDLSDKNISKILDISSLFSLADHLTRLTLSHNKIDSVPPAIVELHKLEILNLFNNHIEELPTNFSSMQNLKRLNLGMNRLYQLPRGFGAFPKLEVLDVTYNNLSENSLSKNFFLLGTLRALYLSDNDFEVIPEEIGKLTQLKQLAIRDNDLISLPQAIGELSMLRELHIQGNRLTVLPPELGKLDLYSNQAVFRADNNPWVPPINDQFQVGVSHVFEYIRSDTYKYLYGRHMQAGAAPPPKKANKSKKICKREIWAKK